MEGIQTARDARRISHYLKLEKDYCDALEAVHRGVGDKFDAYKEKLIKDGCPHPSTYVEELDCDNGYGKWWKVWVTKCLVCGESLNTDHGKRGE